MNYRCPNDTHISCQKYTNGAERGVTAHGCTLWAYLDRVEPWGTGRQPSGRAWGHLVWVPGGGKMGVLGWSQGSKGYPESA